MSSGFYRARPRGSLLTRTREATGDATPEDVFLGFDPLTGEIEPDALGGARSCQGELRPRRPQTRGAVGSRRGRARLPRGPPTVAKRMQLSRAGQRARTRAAFHSLFGMPRICSRLLASRAAVSLSAWLRRPVNRDAIRVRAASSASAATFGPAGTEAPELVSDPGAPWLSCSWGRRSNSSGQDCRMLRSALTQETWSRPNSFILAFNVTGSVRVVSVAGWSATLMIVSRGGRA